MNSLSKRDKCGLRNQILWKQLFSNSKPKFKNYNLVRQLEEQVILQMLKAQSFLVEGLMTLIIEPSLI